MSRKLTVVVVIVALVIAGVGCRKKPAQQPAPPKTEVKSQAEYDSQAKKDINSVNMKAELDKIEKDVQQERGRGF